MSAAVDHWDQVKSLFDALLTQPPEQHERVIAAARLPAGAEAELRTLLRHHAQATGAGDFLAAPAAPLGVPPARTGQRLGAWLLVRALGEGGMGEVFEARRADGSYEGRAAVKLLKRGLGSAAVLQRFAQERNALARLNHPHIARLLDAGASDDGQPYFVMEYVDGRPIHDAALGLPLAQRLKLFLQLADAVAHAHRNLLVHRDLKPSNVLVDGEGQVKLLDFGIAKALDPGAEGELTALGDRPFTPHYASPEQVRGEPVNTATDVYSLGVLLYQMLTGARPTGRAATTAAAAVRGVLEEPPTRASQLPLSDVQDPAWAQTRRALQGDLDHVLLKALEKSPLQRYASVDALAQDIRLYLQGRPVHARAAGPWDVLLKFIRRNPGPVLAGTVGGVGLVAGLAATLLQGRLAAALGVLGLAGGLGLALAQARRAEQARQDAERHVAELRRLSREVVVEYGDAITFVPGGAERKVAMLRSTVAYLEALQRGLPRDAGLKAELGTLHARLAHLRVEGEFNATANGDEVVQHGRRAVALCEAAEAGGHRDPALFVWWALALGDLARVAQAQGQLPQALGLLQGADTLLQRAAAQYPGHAELRRTQTDILMLMVELHFGWGKPNLGQPEEALAGMARAKALYEEAAQGPEASAHDVFQLGTVAGGQALVLVRLERWDEAIAVSREGVRCRERAADMEPHNRMLRGGAAAECNLLGGLLLDTGQPQEALGYTSKAWAILERLLADDGDNASWHSQRHALAFNHGRALLGCGRAAEALPVLAVSADWLQRQRDAGPLPPRMATRLARTWLAQALARQDTLPQALMPGLQLLQELLQRQPQEREAWLTLAELQVQALQHAAPEDAPGWRAQALASYERAEALRAPLTALHAQRVQALRSA